MKVRTIAAATAILAIVAEPTWAHPTVAPTLPFAWGHGFLHPWLGLDHLLAMLAVGMAAVYFGGRARILLPATFLVAMAGGGLIAASVVASATVEFFAAASLLALGVVLASGRRYPLGIAIFVAAILGIFHGHLHGTELAGGAVIAVWSGLLSATAILHLLGGLSAWIISCAVPHRHGLRIAGSILAIAGGLLALIAI